MVVSQPYNLNQNKNGFFLIKEADFIFYISMILLNLDKANNENSIIETI
jgi:hypothetical protein